MAKEFLLTLTEEVEVANNQTITREVGSVVKATPKTGGDTYIRLQINQEGTWIYGGDVNTFDPATEDLDPSTGNWIPETVG